jgi:uncharacterized protein (TIGR00661 family)
MKILYAIQGTGNGHVCRAHDIVPMLARKAEVDVLISGIQSDIQLPFPVKYRFNGLSFIFGKKGGVDLLATYKKSRLRELLKEVSELPVHDYNLVISDFEPVSSWACAIKNKPCVSLSHQAAVMNKSAPKPKNIDPLGKAIMKVYAPATVHYGFHFNAYSDNIFTPVIRQEVRNAEIANYGHYTVYLPAYSDKRILRVLSQFTDTKWHVFSKHFTQAVECDNIVLTPVNNNDFIRSMATSAGVLCGAGFETPAEALFLRKKLLVIPMKNQYEQHCNAAALRQMGVPVIKSLKQKHIHTIDEWIRNEQSVAVDYKDQTEQILERILAVHASEHLAEYPPDEWERPRVKDFRRLTITKILNKLAN